VVFPALPRTGGWVILAGMKFSLADNASGYAIHAYDEGEVQVAGRTFRHSLIVSAGRLIEDWRPAAFEALTADDFAPIGEQPPDLLLLGTGRSQRFPPQSLYAALRARGIALEAMNDGAACRTYNILLSEGRHVALALLLG